MQTVLTTLGLVFLAELGDKTQLVALGLGARHRLGPVLAGMAVGYGASNLLASVVGGVLGATLPTRGLGIVGGVVFLGFAVAGLRGGEADAGSDERGPVDAGERAGRTGTVRLAASVAVTILVAEAGDKTQLATATLAAQADPVLVWVGATVGVTLSGAVGVAVGRVVGSRLPDRALRRMSSVLFAAFGVALVATNL